MLYSLEMDGFLSYVSVPLPLGIMRQRLILSLLEFMFQFAKGMNGVLMPSFSFQCIKATILDGLSLARTDSISIV